MSKLDDIRMMLKNAYGLSDEDVTRVVRMVSEIVAEQMPQPAPAAPSAEMASKEFVAAYVDGVAAQLRFTIAEKLVEERVAVLGQVDLMIAQGMERMAGAFGDAVSEGRVARAATPLWWALDTLLLEYEGGGTFEDLWADLVRLKDEHRSGEETSNGK